MQGFLAVGFVLPKKQLAVDPYFQVLASSYVVIDSFHDEQLS